MHFPCVFRWWTSEFLQMVFILVEFPKMENRILVLHSWVFFETDDCNRNYFTYSDCIQKTLVFTVVFACATVWKIKIFRYIWSNTPPPPGRSWGGGRWPYIYIYTIICILTINISYQFFINIILKKIVVIHGASWPDQPLEHPMAWPAARILNHTPPDVSATMEVGGRYPRPR